MSTAAELVVPLGQGEPFAEVVRLARKLSSHHALMVIAPPGGGKSTVSRYLAAAYLCAEGGEAPCGRCRECLRVATGMHPDLHSIGVPEGKAEVPIEDVRELRQTLDRTSVEGRARVVLIEPADRLSHPAQNALLKTLEEPGRDMFLVLATSGPERLLETVRSRTVPLRLQPLSEAVLERELARDFPDRPAEIARVAKLARGSLGMARELLTEHAVQMHDLVAGILAGDEGLGAPSAARAVLAGASDNRERVRRARLFLFVMRSMARERLLEHLEQPASPAYASASIDRWNVLFDALLSAEADLELHVPAELALCGLLLQWESTRASAAGAGGFQLG